MSVSRRGLLKALGLGGVGLVAGAAAAPLAKAAEPVLTPEPNVESPKPERLIVRQAPRPRFPDWEHPDLDRIEAVMRLTGGYPNFWGQYGGGPVFANNGDMINVNYRIDDTFLQGGPIELQRCYDVQCAIVVMGQALQGPVVQDHSTELGHRLATLDELKPNHEETLRRYGVVG